MVGALVARENLVPNVSQTPVYRSRYLACVISVRFKFQFGLSGASTGEFVARDSVAARREFSRRETPLLRETSQDIALSFSRASSSSENKYVSFALISDTVIHSGN